jgi:hypothetical protein
MKTGAAFGLEERPPKADLRTGPSGLKERRIFDAARGEGKN